MINQLNLNAEDFIPSDPGIRDCYPGEWPCPGSSMCVPINKVCDEHPDCPGGTDESNTTAHLTCGKYLKEIK